MDLHKILLDRRNALRLALSQDVDFLKEGLDTEDGTAMNCAEVETKELERIDAALVKVQEGTYGLCEDCGKRINKTRLEALPYVTRCLNCQLVSEGEEPLPEPEVNWERLGEKEVGDVIDERVS